MSDAPEMPPRFELMQDGPRLSLYACHRPTYGPVSADWDSAAVRRRVQGGRRQLLARAVGLHRRPVLSVVDATAGLGRDAYVLAALGARVTMLERQPMVCCLLRDALARRAPPLPNLELVEADAIEWLDAHPRFADVVLLDPMYPHDGKQALAKKEMQFLRELSGGDADADALLGPALRAARRRVAVKRPLKAPPLAGRGPDLRLTETQARYDLYLIADNDA